MTKLDLQYYCSSLILLVGIAELVLMFEAYLIISLQVVSVRLFKCSEFSRGVCVRAFLTYAFRRDCFA